MENGMWIATDNALENTLSHFEMIAFTFNLRLLYSPVDQINETTMRVIGWIMQLFIGPNK